MHRQLLPELVEKPVMVDIELLPACLRGQWTIVSSHPLESIIGLSRDDVTRPVISGCLKALRLSNDLIDCHTSRLHRMIQQELRNVFVIR